MNWIDWLILFGTIAFIAVYGFVRTRGSRDIDAYLKGDNKLRWWMIGVSIMATQASAITFLSTPGQAIEDGMRFLQFYFGLPIAMVIISVTMVPIYYRLKVFTAYEYLEGRFDLKTRLLAACLFLVQRGLSAGITIFAPSIVLSTLLGWKVGYTTMLIGAGVVLYLVSGGSRAVSLTQRQQLSVVMFGMILAGVLAFTGLPDNVSFGDSLKIAGNLGKFNLVDFHFNINERYNVWSGLLAGTFLFLSYFGTDQSQVGRYLGGHSLTESRLGLIFNGLLKLPMQFIILFIGVMIFIFYLFHQPPVFHNKVLLQRAMATAEAPKLESLQLKYDSLYGVKRKAVDELVDAIHSHQPDRIDEAKQEVLALQGNEKNLRNEVRATIKEAIPAAKTQDTDYIFLNFVLTHLPHGIIGLVLAVMFSAAMSSMSSELNALASTSTVDLYRRVFRKTATPSHYVLASRIATIVWILLAMSFAMAASFSENLIQFVNIVGSLFYGTILGIFLVAFYVKHVKGSAVFIAAIVAEVTVLYCYFFTHIAYLLFNIIGCAVVMGLALILQRVLPTPTPAAK